MVKAGSDQDVAVGQPGDQVLDALGLVAQGLHLVADELYQRLPAPFVLVSLGHLGEGQFFVVDGLAASSQPGRQPVGDHPALCIPHDALADEQQYVAPFDLLH